MHMLVAALSDHSVIDHTLETTAKQYFALQDKGWPASAKPKIGQPLLLDGLAVVYLQHVGLFETVLDTFKASFIHMDTEEEASTLIEHDHHVAEVLRVVDNIRDAVRQAHASGKIIFGPRRPEAKESEREV